MPYTSLGFQMLLILNRLRTKLELSELSELPMQGDGGSLIGDGSFIRSVETSEMRSATGGPYLSPPTLADARNTLEARSVAGSIGVAGILRMNTTAQIDDPIIRPVSIDVVDLRGMVTVDIEPRQPMSVVTFPVERDDDVTVLGPVTGRLIEANTWPPLAPAKLPSFRVIIKRVSYLFGSNHASPSTKDEHEEGERDAARRGADEEGAEDDRADTDQRANKRTGTASQVWGDHERTARTK